MTRDDLTGFLEDLGGLLRARRMYPSGNQQVSRAAEKAAASLGRMGRRVRIARIGQDIIAEDRTLVAPPTALRALLDRVGDLGWEGLQFEPGATAEEFGLWIESVITKKAGDWTGRHIRAGSLDLRAGGASASQLAQAAAGYLSLLPGVQEVLSDLAHEREGGLVRAREIVRAIAAQLAVGEELVNPIRGLRTHDDYTFTHALNVCVISAALARGLGLDKWLVDSVSLAALCHDVGKEKVPSEILNKQDPLDAREMEIIERHPVEGAALLLRLSEPVDPLLPIVAYQHHLGADGSGYPVQPSPFQAHPASLLVAVADVYDAMRTIRAYQEPHSSGAAFNVMLRKARSGALHEGILGALARLLEVLQPGDRVSLSDGCEAVLVKSTDRAPLRPIVEMEGGGILDLRVPGSPRIDAILDARETKVADTSAPVVGGEDPFKMQPLDE